MKETLSRIKSINIHSKKKKRKKDHVNIRVKSSSAHPIAKLYVSLVFHSCTPCTAYTDESQKKKKKKLQRIGLFSCQRRIYSGAFFAGSPPARLVQSMGDRATFVHALCIYVKGKTTYFASFKKLSRDEAKHEEWTRVCVYMRGTPRSR